MNYISLLLVTDFFIKENFETNFYRRIKRRSKRHICLRTDNIQKTTLLLEQKGNINNYSVYPDNSIRIYECLDNVRMISKLLSSNGVIIDEISVQGENLETYFENLIGGRKNV